jgi:hypothetical protein
MTDLTALEPHEILDQLELRNRRFKVASVVFAAFCLIGLVLLLVLGLQTLQKVNSQLASQKKLLGSQQQVITKIAGAAKSRTAQINDLQQHIDCIVGLFQLPNRQDLTITNVEGCQIGSNGTITPGGSTNGTQKTTNSTSSNNTRTTTTPAQSSVSSPTGASSVPAQTTQTAPATNPLIKTTDGLFCPISLTSFACSK